MKLHKLMTSPLIKRHFKYIILIYHIILEILLYDKHSKNSTSNSASQHNQIINSIFKCEGKSKSKDKNRN